MAVIVTFRPPAATLNRKLSGRRNRSGTFWSFRESNHDSSDDSFCKQSIGIKFCRRHEASGNLTHITRGEKWGILSVLFLRHNTLQLFRVTSSCRLAACLSHLVTTPGDDYEKPTPGITSKALLLCLMLPSVSHQACSDSEYTRV